MDNSSTVEEIPPTTQCAVLGCGEDSFVHCLLLFIINHPAFFPMYAFVHMDRQEF